MSGAEAASREMSHPPAAGNRQGSGGRSLTADGPMRLGGPGARARRSWDSCGATHGIREVLPGIPESPKVDGMKTTLDIPEHELREAIRHTGAKTKREAVVIALSEINRRRRLQKLVEKFGTLDGFMTQEELRRMREDP